MSGQDTGERGSRRRAMRIMEALSGVDEALLERCGESRDNKKNDRYVANVVRYDRRRKDKTLRKAAGTWAAVLCLAVVGAVSWGGYQLSRNYDEGSTGSADMAVGLEAIQLDNLENGAARDVAAAGTEEAEREDWHPVAWQEKEDAAVKSQEQTSGNASVSGSGEAGGNEATAERAEDSIESEESERELEEDKGCPALNSIDFTEAEARSLETLGAYIPETLPAGYVFESAYRNLDISEENLTILWSRGMDSIMLNIRTVEVVPDTVDVEKTEAYDRRLYAIPYAESVPEQYWEDFDHPVFAVEDLTLEVVESRMIAREDRGDTDTPQGDFSILYPEGVVVRFSGRGTPGEIWEMFGSVD